MAVDVLISPYYCSQWHKMFISMVHRFGLDIADTFTVNPNTPSSRRLQVPCTPEYSGVREALLGRLLSPGRHVLPAPAVRPLYGDGGQRAEVRVCDGSRSRVLRGTDACDSGCAEVYAGTSPHSVRHGLQEGTAGKGKGKF